MSKQARTRKRRKRRAKQNQIDFYQKSLASDIESVTLLIDDAIEEMGDVDFRLRTTYQFLHEERARLLGPSEGEVTQILFTGQGTDTVKIDGCSGEGSFTLPSSKEAGCYKGFFDLVCESERLRVHAIFDGCWSFAVGLVQANELLPRWPNLAFNSPNGHTSVLEIEAPVDVVLRPQESQEEVRDSLAEVVRQGSEEMSAIQGAIKMLRRVTEAVEERQYRDEVRDELGQLQHEIGKLENLTKQQTLVRFTGHSDDLVEVEGCEGADEFDVGFGNGHMRSFDLLSQEGRARVHAFFDGCWSFAVGRVDDGDPLPDWPIRVKNGEKSYTTVLEILAPADVTVALQERS